MGAANNFTAPAGLLADFEPQADVITYMAH